MNEKENGGPCCVYTMEIYLSNAWAGCSMIEYTGIQQVMFQRPHVPPPYLDQSPDEALSALDRPIAGISPMDALTMGACEVRHTSRGHHLTWRPHALPNVLIERLEPPSM